MLGLERHQLLAQVCAHLGGVDRKLLLLNELQHSIGGRGGDRISTKRRNRRSLQRIGDLWARNRYADRRSVRETLGAGDHVRLNAPLFDSEPLSACAPPAGLNLVANE